jgi:SH3-like domain-containing protein
LFIDATMLSASPAPSSRHKDANARRSVKLGRLTRRPLLIVAVVMLLASAFSARAEQVCVPPNIGGKNTLELHTGPGFDFPGRAMANGTVVTVIEERNDWLKVRTAEGKTGWAYRPRVCSDAGPKR